VLKIDFLKIFWQITPVLNSYKKTKKNTKNRLLGPMSRSKLCENGPEIVEKKNTLLHIEPHIFVFRVLVSKKKQSKRTSAIFGNIFTVDLSFFVRYRPVTYPYHTVTVKVSIKITGTATVTVW
jgi:hypothetical protein